ncbi:MAG: F510_1955 family glycosylhydrolase [Jiangellaceae bacterium]
MPVAVVAMLALIGAAVWLAAARDDSAATDPSAGGDPGIAHVHGLGVDPADGTLYAATHFGLFKIPDGESATRVADRYQDTMGFTVVGPNHFLGSGHPDLREAKPALLGLIESTDAGNTWVDLSLSGQADFHALEAKHDTVYGFDSTSGRFMVSDNKTDWDTRTVLPMGDFTVSPDNPELVLATTEHGLVSSTDGGRAFATIDEAPPLLLVSWPTTDALYGVTTSAAVLASADGGATWEQRGSLDGSPEALTAIDAQTVHAATDQGIYTSTDGGRSFTLRYSHPQAN